MKKLIVVLVLSLFSTLVLAEKWSAIGILVTQIDGQEAKSEFIELDDFESEDLCRKEVAKESHSRDYIGRGGTNNSLPAVQWNFDADCIKKRGN